MKIKVSELIANFLYKNGIEDVFAITGGGAMHLDDALGHHPKLNVVFNHHEQACAIAAEGYAKYSGKLPAVCVTSGPGGTNALTGVLCAWLDSIPMFVLSGQVKRITTTWSSELPLRQIGDQEYNIVASVSPMSKYAHMITEPNEILYHLEKALFLCKNGRPGPVWLDIPLDVQAAIVETDDLRKYDSAEDNTEMPAIPDVNIIKEFIDKVSKAKRPVIIAGTGIRIGHAHNAFLKMIEKLQIPVITAWNAHDVLWNEHPLYCGRPGTIGTRGGNFITQNCDLLISLGCRLNVRQISYSWESFAKKAYKVMVDIDDAELHKHTLKIDMPIHADVKDFMNAVIENDYHPKIEHKEWLQWCKNVDARYPAVISEYLEKHSPVNPYVFMDRMTRCLKEGDTIVASNGSACVISFQAAYLKKNQRLFTNSGCATMGYGLPSAIGVSIQKKNQRVICLEGDGSIQMNIQELQTIVQNQLNIKVFWLNNDGYLSMKQTQNNLFQPPLIGVNKQSGVSFPSAEKIAIAYAIPYHCISDIDKIEEVVHSILDTNGPIICEVMLDPNQNFEPKLSSKVLEDGSIISPEIDDMYPFLSRDEYLSNKLD